MQKRAKPKHWESYEQQAVVQYIIRRYPNILFTSSLAGVKVSMITMVALKRCGYSKGSPDLMIFEPRNGYHGLFIEMKTSNTVYTQKRKPTPEQLEWQQNLRDRGFAAHICYGADEAMKVIDAYFAIKTPQNAAQEG